MAPQLFARGLRYIKRVSKRRRPLGQPFCLDRKRFLFIGGLHRSGTSILHRVLREHPSVSGFHNTGVPEDEGQHLQSVFPPANRFKGGPGRFAFDLRSHLTEASELNTPENRENLLRQWGAYYDLTKDVLLEKSPPNLIRSRFIGALFPNAHFVFVIRHPVAVALATKKWSSATVMELLLHWHVAYSLMLADLENLENRYTLIRYEDFINSPQKDLEKICSAMGMPGFFPRESVVGHNSKYLAVWDKEYGVDRQAMKSLFPFKGSPIEIFGYSLDKPYVGPWKGPVSGK